MILEIVFSALTVVTVGLVARYHWATRRQPIRRDSPVREPWVQPRRWHDDA